MIFKIILIIVTEKIFFLIKLLKELLLKFLNLINMPLNNNLLKFMKTFYNIYKNIIFCQVSIMKILLNLR